MGQGDVDVEFVNEEFNVCLQGLNFANKVVFEPEDDLITFSFPDLVLKILVSKSQMSVGSENYHIWASYLSLQG